MNDRQTVVVMETTSSDVLMATTSEMPTNDSQLAEYEDNSTTSTSQGADASFRALEDIFGPLSLLVTILGILGSVFTLVVMGKKRFRRLPASNMVRCLAACDLVFLLCVINNDGWYQRLIMMDVKALSPVTCKAVYFGIFAFNNTSVWMVMLITVERFVAVKHAIKFGRWFSYKNTVYFTLITSFSIILVTLVYSIFSVQFVNGVCTYGFAWVMQWVLGILIPTPIVVVLNCSIAYRMFKQRQQVAPPQNDPPNLPPNEQQQHQVHSSVSVILFSITAMYLVLQIPIISIHGVAVLLGEDPFRTSVVSLRVAWFVAALLAKVHAAVNFYLYVLVSKAFRKSLRRTIVCSKLFTSQGSTTE